MTHSLRSASRIVLRTVFALIVVCASLGRVTAVSCAPGTIVITATVTDAQGRTTDAQTTLTAMDLPDAVALDEAKSLADGAVVRVRDLVASTSSSSFEGLFYAQRSDRSGGIGVIWTGTVSCGSVVSVVGALTTLHGERFIQADLVESSPASP